MRNCLRILVLAAMTTGLAVTAGFAKPTKKSEPKPISAITREMTVVASDLSKTQTGEPVQIEQKIIVRDLDDLIAALEKECSGCRAGIKKNNPRNGMRDSMISGGTGGIGLYPSLAALAAAGDGLDRPLDDVSGGALVRAGFGSRHEPDRGDSI